VHAEVTALVGADARKPEAEEVVEMWGCAMSPRLRLSKIADRTWACRIPPVGAAFHHTPTASRPSDSAPGATAVRIENPCADDDWVTNQLKLPTPPRQSGMAWRVAAMARVNSAGTATASSQRKIWRDVQAAGNSPQVGLSWAQYIASWLFVPWAGNQMRWLVMPVTGPCSKN
jgi:hypothetical protein